jgi:hypothetical protein
MTTATPAYDPLAVNPDAGFPQLFRQTLGERTYRFVLYVNVAEDLLEGLPDEAVLALPLEHAFAVLRIDRETGTSAAVPLFRRKVIPGQQYSSSELAFTFSALEVAKLNINQPGAFGSNISGEVALRWPS